MTTTTNNLTKRMITAFMAVLMVLGSLATFGTTVYASDRADLERSIASAESRIVVAQRALDEAQSRYNNAINDNQRRSARITIDFQANTIAEERARIANFEAQLERLGGTNTTTSVNTTVDANTTTTVDTTANQNNTGSQANAINQTPPTTPSQPTPPTTQPTTQASSETRVSSETNEEYSIHVPSGTHNAITLYQTGLTNNGSEFEVTRRVYDRNGFIDTFGSGRFGANDNPRFFFEGRRYTVSDFFNLYSGLAFEILYEDMLSNGPRNMNMMSLMMAQEQKYRIHVPQPTYNSITLYRTERWSTFGFDRTRDIYDQSQFSFSYNLGGGATFVLEGRSYTPNDFFNIYKGLAFDLVDTVRGGGTRVIHLETAKNTVELIHPNPNNLFIPSDEQDLVTFKLSSEYAEAVRVEFYRLVNEHRANYGRLRLYPLHELELYADIRAAEQRVLLGHTRPDGGSSGSGWSGSWGGEAAQGVGGVFANPHRTAYRIFAGWRNSPGHNQFMLAGNRPDMFFALGLDIQLDSNGRVSSPAIFALGQ